MLKWCIVVPNTAGGEDVPAQAIVVAPAVFWRGSRALLMDRRPLNGHWPSRSLRDSKKNTHQWQMG
jgi:hypothetical protein